MEEQLCVGAPVVVVGGGNSAGQATVFLSHRASKVYLLLRGELTRDMSRYLADRIERLPNVEILRNTEIRELLGEDSLDGVIVADLGSGERRRLDVRDAVRLHRRRTVHGLARRRRPARRPRFRADRSRRVPESRNGEAPPALLETGVPGILAAGDVRAGSIKRVASAVGEGAMAVRLVNAQLNP